MRIVQTFYYPTRSSTGGWLFETTHLMSWALSCLQLRRYHHSVTLYTNQSGREVLIDQLQLPYTDVVLLPESLLDEYPRSMWAVPKLYTYAAQQEPFLHVDGDVFIWQAFNSDLEQYPLIVQNREQTTYYSQYLSALRDQAFVMPDCLSRVVAPVAVNAGVLGGCDGTFMTNYTQQALSFIRENAAKITALETGEFTNINIIAEQLLFFYLAGETHTPIHYLFAENAHEQLCQFNTSGPAARYVHPIGSQKKYWHTAQQVSNHLRIEHPHYFKKLLKVYEKDQRRLRSKWHSIGVQEPGEIRRVNLFTNPLAIDPAPSLPASPSGSYVNNIVDQRRLELLTDLIHFDETLTTVKAASARVNRAASGTDPDCMPHPVQAYAANRLLTLTLDPSVALIDTLWDWTVPNEFITDPDHYLAAVRQRIERTVNEPPRYGKTLFVRSLELDCILTYRFTNNIHLTALDSLTSPRTVQDHLTHLKKLFQVDAGDTLTRLESAYFSFLQVLETIHALHTA